MRRWLILVLGGLLAVGCGDSSSHCNQNLDNQNNDNQAGPVCGDGQIEPPEACDDGTANSNEAPDASRLDCALHRCGDGVIDTEETCDDGASNADNVPDACRLDCQPSRCGDLVVDLQRGEQCDDGNQTPGDGCDDQCLMEFCGNGRVDPGEVCDDGDNSSGDGCSGDCQSTEVCGNGYVDVARGEACDCGTGLPLPEGCEGPNSDAPGATCRINCTLPGCGDGVLEGLEQCDGNELGSATCLSLGFYLESPLGCTGLCSYDTSQCLGYCGNGAVDGPEQCDGTELGGAICEDLGYTGGNLGCTQICGYDTSGCT
jgi:cysteine-rich repeat protein